MLTNISPKLRKYLYRVLVALAAVLVAHHAIAPDNVPMYLTLVEAVLGLGAGVVANANVNE